MIQTTRKEAVSLGHAAMADVEAEMNAIVTVNANIRVADHIHVQAVDTDTGDTEVTDQDQRKEVLIETEMIETGREIEIEEDQVDHQEEIEEIGRDMIEIKIGRETEIMTEIEKEIIEVVVVVQTPEDQRLMMKMKISVRRS